MAKKSAALASSSWTTSRSSAGPGRDPRATAGYEVLRSGDGARRPQAPLDAPRTVDVVLLDFRLPDCDDLCCWRRSGASRRDAGHPDDGLSARPEIARGGSALGAFAVRRQAVRDRMPCARRLRRRDGRLEHAAPRLAVGPRYTIMGAMQAPDHSRRRRRAAHPLVADRAPDGRRLPGPRGRHGRRGAREERRRRRPRAARLPAARRRRPVGPQAHQGARPRHAGHPADGATRASTRPSRR